MTVRVAGRQCKQGGRHSPDRQTGIQRDTARERNRDAGIHSVKKETYRQPQTGRNTAREIHRGTRIIYTHTLSSRQGDRHTQTKTYRYTDTDRYTKTHTYTGKQAEAYRQTAQRYINTDREIYKDKHAERHIDIQAHIQTENKQIYTHTHKYRQTETDTTKHKQAQTQTHRQTGKHHT